LTTGRNGDGGTFDDVSMEDMEALLDEESLEFRSLRRGDVLDGIVMETSREGVLVDIGSKSEGLIPLNEMHSLGADPLSKVKRGDELLVYVVQPESAEGQVLLSLDRARGEHGWRTLQKRFEDGESFEGEVTGFNKGGLLVNVEGVNAFVPLSQVVGVRPDRDEGDGGLQAVVGRKLRLKVIEINRRRNRVILSERAAMQEWRSQQKDRLLAELQEGEIRRGRITSVRPFGVFVDLGGADGLAHLSELTWERGKTPEEVYKVGDEVDVYVMKVDPETKKIALSLRRAQPERWDEIVDQYRPGQIVPGRITKLVTFGAFARIDGPVEGLIHVSELSDRRIQHPREVVREGDIVPLKVVRIERDKHRIGLSLRQARDEAETQGWEFDSNGSVRSFPEFLRAEIEAKLGVSPRRPAEERPPRGDRDGQRTADVEDEDVPPTGFAALRGFQSEADAAARAAEGASRQSWEAGGGQTERGDVADYGSAAATVDAEPPEAGVSAAVPSGTITAPDAVAGVEAVRPEPEVLQVVVEEEPEGAITQPEEAEVEALATVHAADDLDPPPNGSARADDPGLPGTAEPHQ
jgi:small subunit ribosomal protein S1